MKVNPIVAYVDDAQHESGWFASLGLAVRRMGDDHFVISFDGLDLELHSAASETIPEFVSEANAEPRFRGLYLYVRVADVDGLHRARRDQTSYTEPAERPWGNREVLFESPSGLKVMAYSK